MPGKTLIAIPIPPLCFLSTMVDKTSMALTYSSTRFGCYPLYPPLHAQGPDWYARAGVGSIVAGLAVVLIDQCFQLSDGLRRLRAAVLYRVQLVEEFPGIL